MKITEQQLVNHIRERCENDFEFFVRYFFKVSTGQKFMIADFHRKIFSVLTDVWDGKKTHVIINIPPRHGKTLIAVKMFSAWCFAKNPTCEFIHLSYSDELALDNSNSIKELVSSKEFQQLWPTELKKESDRAWKTDAGGAFFARSAGGQVTGYGAGKVNDFKDGNGFGGAILLDDLLKPNFLCGIKLFLCCFAIWPGVIL